MPNILCNLGNSHHIRFLRTIDRVDIDQTIEFYTQAMDITPQGHSSRPAQFHGLGQAYSDRFRTFGAILDIEKAIEFQSQTLELAPSNHPSVPGWLNNLGESYIARFSRLGNLDDINKAIVLLTRAVHLTPQNHINMLAWLTTISNAHRSRFTREGNIEDINQAIEYQTQALFSTLDGHPFKKPRLTNLGSLYRLRFERLGKLDDLENAIKFLFDSLTLEPISSKDLGLLISLGNCYGSKFERLGELSDVDEAIKHLTLAESLATGEYALCPIRFERLGGSEDINKAIDYQSRALSLLPVTHANKGLLLNNLGRSHARRFSHSRKREDINNALNYLTQAISLLPEDHPGLPGTLHNLAHVIDIQPESTAEDIDTAIEYQNRAVSLTPKEHTQLPNFTNSLGLLYRRRYKDSEPGKLDDIDRAIHWLSNSVSLTPEDHARMPLWLTNLGESYLERYKNQKDEPSLYSAIECYQRCAKRPTVFPNIQLSAAFNWARLASISGLPLPEDYGPIKAYQIALDLVPHVVWLGTSIGKQYEDAQSIKNLASSAAALAITFQQYDLALEWLEQGRSVVWGQMLQLRDPLDELADVDPLLATSLRDVATELSIASQGIDISHTQMQDRKPQDDHPQKQHRLAKKYQELIETVRKVPGFNNFLRPAKASLLTRAAQTGPLVVLNASASRCDALVIHPGKEEIVHIPLPDLSLDRIPSIRTDLEASIRQNHARERGIKLMFKPQGKPEDLFAHALATLWTCITKPVLDALGYKSTMEDLPHITWCATGVLSFLPLHASGYYDRPRAKLSDYAVSSYTPTLGILIATHSLPSNGASGILAVGQESTPRMTPLPGTKQELANIEKHVQEPLVYSQLDGYEATTRAVLSAMENHDWVHLACHAYQNIQDPIKSGFFLHDDTLYLKQIARISFQNKGLAFLSACQTATGDKELPDETMHLASGMLMAGYSNVIATMWSIVDEDAPLIADEVYGRLLEGGIMNTGGAARALHQAVCRLREKVGDKAFSRWVPYIHVGGCGTSCDA